MKRSLSYTLIFLFLILVILINIAALSKHHADIQEECIELVIENDSLHITLDTLIGK